MNKLTKVSILTLSSALIFGLTGCTITYNPVPKDEKPAKVQDYEFADESFKEVSAQDVSATFNDADLSMFDEFGWKKIQQSGNVYVMWSEKATSEEARKQFKDSLFNNGWSDSPMKPQQMSDAEVVQYVKDLDSVTVTSRDDGTLLTFTKDSSTLRALKEKKDSSQQ